MIKHKRKETTNINIKDLKTEAIEKELNRVKYKSKYYVLLRSTIYILIIIIAISVVVGTLIMPVIEISGSSMSPKYSTGDIVVSIKSTNIKQGDIIAFYHGNKVLIKRVIATQGDWVDIDQDGYIYVNSIKLKEKYITTFYKGDTDVEYPYQVPADSYFVLSDNRENINDSRSTEVGCVKKSDIIGKLLFRLWPIKK